MMTSMLQMATNPAALFAVGSMLCWDATATHPTKKMAANSCAAGGGPGHIEGSGARHMSSRTLSAFEPYAPSSPG